MLAARRDWLADTLHAVPGAWRERVRSKHAGMMAAAASIAAGTGRRSDAEQAANLWLADTADRMRAIRVPLNLSDAEVCEMARACAAACMDVAYRGPAVNLAALRENMAAFVRRYGIEPPAPRVQSERTGKWSGIADDGALRRMGCALWWRRRLRVAQGRALEREAIRMGYVHRNREIYASTATVERRAQQKKRNADSLAQTTATNQHGDEFTLADLAERAVSNPRIRRGELMTRIAGFESIARGLDHVGVFFTVTCPARMHAKKTNATSGAVFDNPKYDGTTPREAARYLSGMWARCRAALARAGLAVYGFRIAEPHHDATPHWHLLLFMAAQARDAVCELFAKYARREDSGELASESAQAARFLAKDIDWSRGTAAGYIAKYVSKNIDGGGYQVQGDIEGGDHAAITPSHRVEAWAAQWGIRQFQQVGGATVGVWRELRRLKAAEDHGATLAAARSAADVGNWHSYTEAMGGVDCRRADRPLRIARSRDGERLDGDTGEVLAAPLTRYGEVAPGAVFGVEDAASGRAFVTRVFRWEVKRAGQDRPGAGSGFGRLAGPWTRVNNCTERGNDEHSSKGALAARASRPGAVGAGRGADTERGARGFRGNGGSPGRVGRVRGRSARGEQ